MGRKKTEDTTPLLTRSIIVRVTEDDYLKYDKLQQNSDCRSIAEVVRRILAKSQIICYHKDARMDGPMELLTGIQKELQYIGHNINQITKGYHQSRYESQQSLQMERAAEQYQKVQAKVNSLLVIIAQLSRSWLQK